MSKKDALHSAIRWFDRPTTLREPIVRLISANQKEPPHHQVMALALTLELVCRAIDMDAVGIVERARRMVNDVDGPFANQWQAMTAYAKGEILGEDR